MIPSFKAYEKDYVHVVNISECDLPCQPMSSTIVNVEFCNQHHEFLSNIRQFFKPMKLPSILNYYPSKFFKYIPMFNGESHISVEKHNQAFKCFTDNYEVIHEDLVLRTFCKFLYGNAKLWFKHLEVESMG